LTETNTWRNDGRMSAYTAGRSDFTDARVYGYSPLAQRLAGESFYLGSGKTITNNYTTDSGQTGGLGLLTGRAQSGGSSASWTGIVGDPNRFASEQSSLISRSTYGLAQGADAVSATLDGQPLSVQFDGANGGPWWACMDLAAGSHTLQVSAVDPSGLYFFSTNSTFACATNSGDTITNEYYVDGNVSARFWFNSQSQMTRGQLLFWDACNRLTHLLERDAKNNGYNWSAVYDGLGRRVQTSTVLVTNSVAINSQPTTISSFFDPQVEFLEVGVTVNGAFTMKTYGPDANGVYGGMQGVGGLEALNVYGHMTATSVVQDYFGNVIGTIANGVVSWNPARFSSYGPVPGYQQSTLSLSTPLAQSLGWRGKRVDETGYINLGARLYDPVAGRFISADPLGHEASQDLYSFCGGDPVNTFDPDGRCIRSGAAQAGAFGDSFVNGTVGLAQLGLAVPGEVLGVHEWSEEAGMLEGFKSPLQRLGLYSPGTLDAQIGENAALVTAAYGLAKTIPTLATGAAKWWNSLWSEPTPATPSPNNLVVDAYGNLSRDPSISGQAHHLNQDAAFREVIPTAQGASIKLEGNAFADAGTPHYEAHADLEGFWDQFRPVGSTAPPTNLEYTKALADSLRAAGKNEAEVQQAVRAAIQQRVDYGLLGGMPVPRIPGRINQAERLVSQPSN
jgi:RHS repeat-associated protein